MVGPGRGLNGCFLTGLRFPVRRDTASPGLRTMQSSAIERCHRPSATGAEPGRAPEFPERVRAEFGGRHYSQEPNS